MLQGFFCGRDMCSSEFLAKFYLILVAHGRNISCPVCLPKDLSFVMNHFKAQSFFLAKQSL